MKKFISMLAAVFMLATGLVALSAVAPATAAGRECQTTTPTQTEIQHPEVSHVVHHDAVVHTEYYYSKFTHTKTKPPYGSWSAYGPWTQWTPITHDSWETFNVEAIGSPAFHAQGTYQDGTKWYREWQVRNTGQTRTIVDQEAYDETVIDSHAGTETVSTPGSKECTAVAKTKVAIHDVCNCWRDKVTMTGGPHVKIKSSKVNNTTWKFVVTGKKVDDTQYLLGDTIGGDKNLAVTQTYLVHTTNKVCPCKKNHTCGQLYPNLNPPAHHCKGKNCS